MLPFDFDTRKRKINLGGSNSASSSSTILNDVREQRLQRLSQKRQNEAALSIQAFWRSCLSSRELKNELRVTAFHDHGSTPPEDLELTRLRCLMLLGKDWKALERWSGEFVKAGAGGGEEGLFRLAKGRYASNWLVCIRQIAWRLLENLSLDPTCVYLSSLDSDADSYLQVTNVLQSPLPAHHAALDQSCRSSTRYRARNRSSATTPHLSHPPRIVQTHRNIHIPNRTSISYSQQHSHSSLSAQQQPLEQKKHPNLPPLLTLSTTAFTSLPTSSPAYTTALSQLFTHILSIHLLPNRLPVDALPLFLSRIPLSSISTLSSLRAGTGGGDPILQNLKTDDKVNLLANCTMFFTPHYSKFGNESLAWYLHWTSTIFNSLPSGSFDPPSKSQSTTPAGRTPAKSNANDSDDDTIKVNIVDSFAVVEPKPRIDGKTFTRLSKLSALAHLDSLLGYARKSEKVQAGFVAWVLGLNYVRPLSQRTGPPG
jgi:ubiquitin-protein ligase E3 C